VLRLWRSPALTSRFYLQKRHRFGYGVDTELMSVSFSEWANVFGDAKMTTALLDRLTHHCHIVETGNDSWRFRHSSAQAKPLRKASKAKIQKGEAPDVDLSTIE